MKGRRGLAAALAAAALVCLTVAGSAAARTETAAKSQLTEVTLQLKWVTQAQFAGYYAAKEKGFYKAQGLDVTIRPGGPDITPEQVVLSGQADYGLDWLPNLLATREQGGKIVSVAQVFARSGMTELTWKDSGIDSIKKMRGKKVGVWCCGNEPELFAALAKNGINPKDPKQVTIVNQPFDMTLFLQRKIDAAAAMTYNELAQVLETKNPKTGRLYQLSDLNVFRMSDPKVGTAMLEDNIFTTEKYLRANRAQTVKFLKASFQGWIYCRNHVRECVDIVLRNGPTLGRTHQTWQMNEINKLIWPNPFGIGHVSPKAVRQTATIAKTYGVLKKPANVRASVTYQYADQALDQLKKAKVDVFGKRYKPIRVKLTEGGK